MQLAAAVDEAFTPGGALAKANPSFTPRVGQIQMAQAVAKTLGAGGQLVVEAGTGVGKTYAYLVPVLLSGRRALISTATKALQDQLALRDIPRLQEALGVHARVSVLKGRSSYLCLNRLESARQHPASAPHSSQLELARIERWSTATENGDLAEMLDLPDQSPVEPLVTSTRDNCLGGSCPQANICFVNRARAAAMVSDIVVVNHHLFFADLNVRESGVAELLPNTQAVVFDEAHQLNDIGVQFLGRQFSTRQLDELVRDLFKNATALSLGAVGWRDWLDDLAQASSALKVWSARWGQSTTVEWDGPTPAGLSDKEWTMLTDALLSALQQISVLVKQVAESSPEMTQMDMRVTRCCEDCAFFLAPSVPGKIRWLEGGLHLKMLCSPLDIGPSLQGHMASTSGTASPEKSWIFTSATLGTDADFAIFRATCGLQQAEVLQVESPFDYASQAALYVPESFPLPSDPLHSIEVAHFAAQSARVLGGRTLVLTTSLRAMQAIGEALRMHFAVSAGLEVWVQGQASKREILTRFNAAHTSVQPGVVVVAAASFWEGVDIPGDALQLVIIDKIPFLPPDGPMTKARADKAVAAGKNAFREFHLPHAALGLKQGAGRLIRSEQDRGLLVVCDVRLHQKSYGKKLLAALPPMRRLESQSQFNVELIQLTKLSTTDLCWT